jgi:mono/diheme cytochrome c family protein
MPRTWTVTLLVIAAAARLSAADDAAVFNRKCALCHGRDGHAQTPQGRKLRAKDLSQIRLTDAEIERQIREGSRTKSGTPLMPAFGPDLTEAEIQSAIRVVKSFRSPAAK